MSHQVELSHYKNLDYNSKERFCSYWHQIKEVIQANPEKVLEIGPGTGIVTQYLRMSNIEVVTLDYDERLKPDVVSSVLGIPFGNNFFDSVICCEVLEHLPFEDFEKGLFEIIRVSKKSIIISVPDASIVMRINIHIPRIFKIKMIIPLPTFKKNHKFDGEHYWEVGKAGYPLSKIINKIEGLGVKVKKTYRVFEMPYHRFFIIEKLNK